MSERLDVLIIGGGPAGATAATLLARAGWSVAVVEKKRFPRRKVCGECIAATNLSLFRALGIEQAFLDLAGPEQRQVGLFARNVALIADLPPLGEGPDRWGRALGREHLDTLLLRRAGEVGAQIWQPWAAHAVTRIEGGYVCQAMSLDTREVRELYAPLVIAAQGSWEPGPLDRERVPYRPSDLFGFKANFRDCDLTPGLLPVLAFPGGYGGMVLADHGRVTLACCIRRDALRDCRRRMPRAKAAEAVLAHLKDSCRGVRLALAGARREGAWLSAGPLRPGIRAPWRPDGVLVVGNAAGEAHPIVGEGISMAVQSAWLLCERLNARRAEVLSGRGIDAVGREYAASWRKSFAPRIYTAALLAHLAMRPGAAPVVLPVLRRWPAIMTWGAKWSGKVKQVTEILDDDPRKITTDHCQELRVKAGGPPA